MTLAFKARVATMAAALLLASPVCAAIGERSLELGSVGAFSIEERQAGATRSVRLRGFSMHSALAVARTETLREGDAVRVRVLLVLARKGMTGSFDVAVSVPEGVKRVLFGDEGREVWHAPPQWGEQTGRSIR